MNRIYYQGSFKLATDWPREPELCAQDFQFDCLKSIGCACADLVKAYNLAITSAMENGVEFADQEAVFRYLWYEDDKNPKSTEDFQASEGDNWPAPEGAEIIVKETKCPECDGNTLVAGSVPCPKCNARGKLYRKVAVLRSESVKNSAHSYTEGMDTESGETEITNSNWPGTPKKKSESVEKKETGAEKAIKAADRREQIMQLLEKYYDKVPFELVHALDRLNQSTPKE